MGANEGEDVPTDDRDLAEALSTVAATLAQTGELAETTLLTCRLAKETLEWCDHVDVMVVPPRGGLTVPAATDWVGIRVVSIEAETGEGPCIDAHRTGTTITVEDHSKETRWPAFIPRCLDEAPVRSGLGVPLTIGDQVIGSLNLYSDQPRRFDEDDLGAAAMFATHAAVAFAAARERITFERALASRDVIGQAKGILMAQSGITADEAFDVLRRASQRMNRRLAEVAQDLVDRHGSG
ncbi:MAG: ANTAR domain-containing protein [Acidimicrobiales bacterium]